MCLKESYKKSIWRIIMDGRSLLGVYLYLCIVFYVGREYRVLFLSTFEATNKDGSTRNPTKSIADPFVVNTVVTRARSLVVSVGNPYLLLNMEKHMCIKYGEKGKYWSNYLKRCIENNSLEFHSSTNVLDANKQGQLDHLNRAIEECIAVKYDLDESTCVCKYVYSCIYRNVG